MRQTLHVPALQPLPAQELEHAVHAVIVKDNPAYARKPSATSASQQDDEGDNVLPFPASELKESAGIDANVNGQGSSGKGSGPVAEGYDVEAGLGGLQSYVKYHMPPPQVPSVQAGSPAIRQGFLGRINPWGTSTASRRSSKGAVPVAEATEQPPSPPGQEEQQAHIIKLAAVAEHKVAPAVSGSTEGKAGPPSKGAGGMPGASPAPSKPPPSPHIQWIIMAITVGLLRIASAMAHVKP